VRRLSLALLTVTAGPAAAQETVTSAAPDAVSVTLYRDPARGTAPIDRDDPSGFALISETRRVRLPGGPAVLRFEGVAGGILSESAVVEGLPAGVREKNLDADLLSPSALYDRATGRQVLVRRTERTTGVVTHEPAIIRSSGEGAAVLETRAGIETLRCTGLAETIVYPGVPPKLPARPTLSIATDAPAPVEAAVTLTYLAAGFDWQANHVLVLRDGGRLNWSARVTLASGDPTRFDEAGLQLIAGKVDREASEPLYVPDGNLELACWRTDAPPPPPPPPPPPAPAAPPAMMARAESADIVVTGMRVQLERLGDLKLYRAPRPVTVTARGEKQTGLFDREGVPVERFYRTDITGGGMAATELILAMRNRREAGLGLPIPSGEVTVFEAGAARPLLIGEAELADKAEGEKIEIALDAPPGNAVVLSTDLRGRGVTRVTATLSNAAPRAIVHELRVTLDPGETMMRSGGLRRQDGRWVRRVDVPANGEAALSWTTRRAGRDPASD
jgi:hypothetical protein